MNSLKTLVKEASLAVVVLCGVVLVTVAPAAAIENGGIGGKPANPRTDNPRSESIFVYELAPGMHIEDAVQVINNTDIQKTLLVYAVDSQVASGGTFACAQKADQPVSVGTWITLSKKTVTLAPNTSEVVPFVMDIPKTASAGEQNGCIVIQDSEQAAASQSNGVVLSFRSAIRVAVTVPGEITKELDFSGPVVMNIDGKIIRLTVGLKNNGNVSLDSAITTRLGNAFGPDTTAAGTFPVLARSQGVFNFEVKKPFWGGWFAMNATAVYSSDPKQSIGEQGQDSTVESPSRWVFIAPEPLALAIESSALAALLALAIFLFVRHKRHRKLNAQARIYIAQQNESLHSIAKKHRVPWKVIATLNKLKAPYHIEPGQRLKVPSPPKSSDRQSGRASTNPT